MADAAPSGSIGRIEWVLGLLSALIVLALAGFLVREAVSGPKDLPDLRIERLPADPDAPPGDVRFVVRNEGEQTATAVSLALVLRDTAGASVSERRLVIDYLPGRSEATGAFVLEEVDPRLRQELLVEGYLDP
jgi:uncharacterized protein (TIGR02588 family)